MTMKITGTFKTYANLKLAYGLIPTDVVDDEFDSFLKKISGKDSILSNYNPMSKTFDTVLLEEDPTRPGSGIILQQNLGARDSRYGINMGIDKLANIIQTNTIGTIYCTSCGFIVPKSLRYDFEPIFTYGDIFHNLIATNPDNPASITGVTIKVDTADIDGRMYCPKEQERKIFKEVADSFLP